MSWARVPFGLPRVRPQELSRLLGQNPKLCPENVTLKLLHPPKNCLGDSSVPFLRPLVTSGKYRGLWVFFFLALF